MSLWPFFAEHGMGSSQPTLPPMFGSWGVGLSNSSLEAVLRAPYPPFNGPQDRDHEGSSSGPRACWASAEGEAEPQGLPRQALAPAPLTLF